MRYHSTRNKNHFVSASQAILMGLAQDGGLFVPETMPKFDLVQHMDKTYGQLAFEVITTFFPEFREDRLFFHDVMTAYNGFFAKNAVCLAQFDEVAYLELFHGRTCAFKDFALSVLPSEIRAAKRVLGISEEYAILTATSGDTGKAALESFRGQEGIKIAVVYPKSGVSQIQQLQMNSVSESNTLVCGVEGNFDDCQALVKQMLSQNQGTAITSANSINIGRLVPQIAYYFFAYKLLVESGRVAFGDKVDFCVPTGNFGNILSCYMAKQMGLPVGRMVCASNKNNILTDFFATGIYDSRREFFTTISPSMDILVSSNFERLMWFVSQDDSFVKLMMKDLSSQGYFDAKCLLGKLSDFSAGYTTECQTKEEIARVMKAHNYLIDTHTAVASFVQNQQAVKNYPVVVSTASAYKFGNAVLEALGEVPSANEFDVLRQLSKATSTTPPQPLADLEKITVHHKSQGSVQEVKGKIEKFLERMQ